MHFVLLNQFYPPGVFPTGVVLEAVAEALVARGHEVTVVAGRSSALSGQQEGGTHVPRRVPPGAPPGDAPQEKSSVVSGRSLVNPCHPSGSNVQVVRLWGPGWGRKKSTLTKILSYAAYYAGVGWWLLRRRDRADVVVALTSPPYLSLLARAGAWWHGGRHAHWVMDLYPEVMVAHGMLRRGGWAHRLMGALSRWGMGGDRALGGLTLGPDMAERLEQYLPKGRSARWMPLWGTAEGEATPVEVAAMRAARGWADDEVVFLYSGNLGLGHRFQEVLEAGHSLAVQEPERRLRLAFFGEGKRKQEVAEAVGTWQSSAVSGQTNSDGVNRLRQTQEEFGLEARKNREGRTGFGPWPRRGKRAKRDERINSGEQRCHDRNPGAGDGNETGASSTCGVSISLDGYVPQAELAAHLASGDVHLASLDPAWDGMMVPSKLQGIFTAGRPVLFTGSRTCSIGRWILESGGGWVCEPGDGAGHVQAMREALDPAEREQRGTAARAFAAVWFNRDKNVGRIVDWLVGG